MTSTGRSAGGWSGVLVLLLSWGTSLGAADSPAVELARAYAAAVERINEAHVRQPVTKTEEELARRLPRGVAGAIERLTKLNKDPELARALMIAGEAALDLDRVKDFTRIRDRLQVLDPERARELGQALSRPRFIVRGIGGLELPYLEKFADIFTAVLEAYDELFGFAEWSKVPGKKLRVRVHLEKQITRPPHFAPQFPYHSEIDFPVVDARAFSSPTRDGKFLFYGLCHELGHVIAMWGDRRTEEDHHAWAHYTGVTIVEHLSRKKEHAALLRGCRDVRWRSLDKVRIEVGETAPGLKDRMSVLALLVRLHDTVGSRGIGGAINHLDRGGGALRIQHVRYYRFAPFRDALLKTLKSKKARQAVLQIFGRV